ncbi:MAG: DUF4838 domain-containing protein [Planctomycetota bacterium]|jgi:hypothetical protein
MKKSGSVLAVIILTAQFSFGANYLVRNGKPMAEIITTENPISNVKLAASELQQYIKKISGAELPIVNARTNNYNVHILVGESSQTEQLGINDAGLERGAFLMKTVGSKLVLLGKDIDFMPVEPFPVSRSDNKRVLAEWDKLTGEFYGNPNYSIYKGYNKILDMRSQDTNGSLNAVYEFLRFLGVRWYMPGELGEVVPTLKTISLPPMDKVIKPDFELRFMSFNRFAIARQDHIMWALRMGFNNPYGYDIAHGIANVTRRKEMREKYPDMYAVFKGKRDNTAVHCCYSSKTLLKQTVKFVRAMYDYYDFKMVSVMPEDGFSHACECRACMKQATPERTSKGKYSDYVWNFVNNVAKEVYKTHPDRFVTCDAYSTYRYPPLKIKKFSPNVICGIVGGRGYGTVNKKDRKEIIKLQQDWAAKLSTKIFIFENYPFDNRGKYFKPRLFPHAVSHGMKEVKDISFGESVWMGEKRGLDAHEFVHINYYVTGRLYWDADQNVDRLLDEYYKRFFGPASKTMKAFYNHCEQNFHLMRVNPHPSMKKEVIAAIDKCFALLEDAKKRAGEGNAYRQRIDLMADTLGTLQNMRDKIAEGRKNVPELAIKEVAKEIKIDGKLDDKVWQDLKFNSYKELRKGGVPVSKTEFKAYWNNNNLYLGIKCMDPDMKGLNITAEKDDDARLWRGDVVELLIETDEHSFYQLVINPTGAVVDLDRAVTKNNLSWDSMATAAASIGKDAWYVEVKIPILQFSDDPLHNLVGKKPTKDMPWHFNFCRQRIRGKETEFSAYSPTGTKGFAALMKFGKLWVE